MVDITIPEKVATKAGGSELFGEPGLAHRRLGFLARLLSSFGDGLQVLFGLVSLTLLLALVAAVPVVNLVALGWLLEAEGRVGRSGRFRDAFPLIDFSRRLGGMALGIWLWLLPLRFFAGMVVDATLIDPAAPAARRLKAILSVLCVLVAIHLCLALAQGGSFWSFFRPIKNIGRFLKQIRTKGSWHRAEERVQEAIAELRLGHHFWLGLRGFVGAFAWLFIPTLLFASANKTEGLPVLLTLIGGAGLVIVLSWVPLLQARFAVENRLSVMFELRAVRQLYRQAPLCCSIAVIVTFALSLPLYLLTIALPPRDALWLATILFIASIYPARILVGWAYHQAAARSQPAWRILRGLSAAVLLPLLGVYVFLLFFTQAIGQHGKLVLFEHHAVLLPVPF